MTLIILERVPVSLRGFLTRWLLEVEPNIFVGCLSNRVRDAVWTEVIRHLGDRSGAILVGPGRNTQGLAFRVAGYPDREVVDFEGISLIRRRPRASRD